MASSIELAARLSSVVSVQQDMLSVVNDPDKVMRLVVDRTPELTNGTGAVIEMAGRIPLDDLSEACVRERRTIRCDDVENDSRVNAAELLEEGIRSFIIAPLVQGSTAIGVLKTFSAKRNAFDDLDSYTLQLLAGMTSSALMQAHEFRERQASEARYRMLFERNVAGVFRTTLDGRILDCNEALASYLGYASRQELLSRETWDLYHQRSDREQFLAHLQRDRALTNLRIHLKKKDGSSVTGVVNATIIPAEDGESQVLGTMVEEN
jgi:PAS domain S-box-containing protein